MFSEWVWPVPVRQLEKLEAMGCLVDLDMYRYEGVSVALKYNSLQPHIKYFIKSRLLLNDSYIKHGKDQPQPLPLSNL